MLRHIDTIHLYIPNSPCIPKRHSISRILYESCVYLSPSEGNEFIVEEKGEKCIEVRKGHRKEKLLNDEIPNKCFSGESEWPTCTS